MALTICIGFITYGYNIMKGEFWSFLNFFHHPPLWTPSSILFQIICVCFIASSPVVMLLDSSDSHANMFTVMGNKITYHSPSRGSSMELGASITILIFSQYKLPVSTSMCITGPSSTFSNNNIHADKTYRCHRRCRALQWHFQGRELEPCWFTSYFVGAYSTDRRFDRWVDHGHHT